MWQRFFFGFLNKRNYHVFEVCVHHFANLLFHFARVRYCENMFAICQTMPSNFGAAHHAKPCFSLKKSYFLYQFFFCASGIFASGIFSVQPTKLSKQAPNSNHSNCRPALKHNSQAISTPPLSARRAKHLDISRGLGISYPPGGGILK